jgi:hypothetical protein
LPRIEPIVDEYRRHRLTCPGCGTTTCADLPEGVPTGHFSPYTQAVLATLAGAYRLGKGPGRARRPGVLLRGGSARSSDPLPRAGDFTEDQGRLISAIASCERLLVGQRRHSG